MSGSVGWRWKAKRKPVLGETLSRFLLWRVVSTCQKEIRIMAGVDEPAPVVCPCCNKPLRSAEVIGRGVSRRVLPFWEIVENFRD